MHLETKLVQSLIQKQKLSQQQQYALKILAMSDMQLQREIDAMIEENPLLDYHEESLSGSKDDIFEKVANVIYEKETLQDALYLQLHTCNEPIPYEVAEYLIESLDSNGYLNDETLIQSGYDEETIEDALAVLQTFEPAGVFARNLQECLLIQLCFEEYPHAQTAIMIVNYHMQELSTNQRSKISLALNIDIEEVNAAISLIRSLSPKPGAAYANDAIPQTSDALVYIKDDSLHIQMNLTRSYLQINHQYDTIKDDVALAYIKKATKQAQIFLECLDKRNATLSAILTCIFEQQREYFLSGLDLKPLTLKDVASHVHFHESTISRAISQKTIEFEGRYISIKTFFPARLESGQSASMIHQKIRTLIAQENPMKPYSDQQIAQLLEKEDIKISRRTVAKYREQMKLLSAAQRKEYKGGKSNA